MTESARNDSVRNGVAPDQPRPCAASLQARLCAMTSASGASERSPATGSGHSATTRRPSTATMPPPSSTSRSIAKVMSRSFMPTTTRLCASCATLEASAPRCEPGAGDEAEADAARREMPFDDRDLREVPIGVGDRVAAFDRRLAHERLGHHLILDEADRAQRPSAPRDREVGRRERRDPDRLPHPLRDLDAPGRPRSAARASARSTAGSSRGRGGAAGRRRIRARSRRGRESPCQSGGMMRGHERPRPPGATPARDRLANHAVDVPRVGDVLRVAIVRAERDAPGSVLLDEREQRAEVARHRSLADEEPHARPGGVRDPPRR